MTCSAGMVGPLTLQRQCRLNEICTAEFLSQPRTHDDDISQCWSQMVVQQVWPATFRVFIHVFSYRKKGMIHVRTIVGVLNCVMME